MLCKIAVGDSDRKKFNRVVESEDGLNWLKSKYNGGNLFKMILMKYICMLMKMSHKKGGVNTALEGENNCKKSYLKTQYQTGSRTQGKGLSLIGAGSHLQCNRGKNVI